MYYTILLFRIASVCTRRGILKGFDPVCYFFRRGKTKRGEEKIIFSHIRAVSYNFYDFATTIASEYANDKYRFGLRKLILILFFLNVRAVAAFTRGPLVIFWGGSRNFTLRSRRKTKVPATISTRGFNDGQFRKITIAEFRIIIRPKCRSLHLRA